MSDVVMGPVELGAPQVVQAARASLPAFCAAALKIRTKSGQVMPLRLNDAQVYLHGRLEEQRVRMGMVRAIILKGRQQGCSTYTEARFYKRVTEETGYRAFILTHEDKATQNLFDMVDRYHSHCPAFLKPLATEDSAKVLTFGALDSGYGVGTAKAGSTGRSFTFQLFHGSEVGFWDNADGHMAGVLQTVPRETGTEIILESTANGTGNTFHKIWQEAEAGLNEFIPIFIPWFWQREYRAVLPDGFTKSPEEMEYQEAYGIDDQQLYWRRLKIGELGGKVWLFNQEYPATPAIAFQSPTEDPMIDPDTVARARRATGVEARGELRLGVDPADSGKDRWGFALRRGRVVVKAWSKANMETMEGVGYVGRVIDENKPDRVFVDKVGIGAGVYGRLRELGYNVIGVHSGEKATEDELYANKRAELWANLKAWLSDRPNKLPDSDELASDLGGPGYKYDSSRRLLLEKKEDMKKRGIRSPDVGDAVALTFWVGDSVQAGDGGKLAAHRLKRRYNWRAGA